MDCRTLSRVAVAFLPRACSKSDFATFRPPIPPLKAAGLELANSWMTCSCSSPLTDPRLRQFNGNILHLFWWKLRQQERGLLLGKAHQQYRGLMNVVCGHFKLPRTPILPAGCESALRAIAARISASRNRELEWQIVYESEFSAATNWKAQQGAPSWRQAV